MICNSGSWITKDTTTSPQPLLACCSPLPRGWPARGATKEQSSKPAQGPQNNQMKIATRECRVCVHKPNMHQNVLSPLLARNDTRENSPSLSPSADSCHTSLKLIHAFDVFLPARVLPHQHRAKTNVRIFHPSLSLSSGLSHQISEPTTKHAHRGPGSGKVCRGPEKRVAASQPNAKTASPHNNSTASPHHH